MLAIGDELLSGRTKDKNIGQLADMLFLAGIDLKEVRIVGDEEDAIVEALKPHLCLHLRRHRPDA
jgi:molybdopterin-biosynthesis enzyme MoeA-like protein